MQIRNQNLHIEITDYMQFNPTFTMRKSFPSLSLFGYRAIANSIAFPHLNVPSLLDVPVE